MRFYDSDFDYAQEIIDNWNNSRKRMRTFYFILAALLILAGIATAAIPAGFLQDLSGNFYPRLYKRT